MTVSYVCAEGIAYHGWVGDHKQQQDGTYQSEARTGIGGIGGIMVKAFHPVDCRQADRLSKCQETVALSIADFVPIAAR